MPALNDVLLLLLFLAGAVICCSGLILLFKRTEPETGAAKVEFFGQKLEANSKGIVVFLVGAGFLAAPLYLMAQRPETAAKATSSNLEVKKSPAAEAAASGAEAEDNNSSEKSNVLVLGGTVTGHVTAEDEDWYSVNSVSGSAKQLRVSLRSMHDGCVAYDLFSVDNQKIAYAQSCSRSEETQTYQVPQGISKIRVHSIHWSGNYELSAAAP